MTGPYISGSNTKVATAAQWAASLHPLSKGRLGVASDTGVSKVGDGRTLWDDLPAVPGGGGASSADAVSYDPGASGLDATDVQGALDALTAGEHFVRYGGAQVIPDTASTSLTLGSPIVQVPDGLDFRVEGETVFWKPDAPGLWRGAVVLSIAVTGTPFPLELAMTDPTDYDISGRVDVMVPAVWALPGTFEVCVHRLWVVTQDYIDEDDWGNIIVVQGSGDPLSVSWAARIERLYH